MRQPKIADTFVASSDDRDEILEAADVAAQRHGPALVEGMREREADERV